MVKHYIELILKKQKYIYQLTLEKEAIDKELVSVLEDQKAVSDKIACYFAELNHYEIYEMEYTIHVAVLVIGVLILFLSLAGLTVFTFLNINMLIAFLGVLGFNVLNLVVCFGITKITQKYYQNKRDKHQKEIKSLNEQIQIVNGQAREIAKRYDEMYNKSKTIAFQILNEERDIERIKQAIVNGLLKVSDKELEILNPILDRLIEKEILSNEQRVIEQNINRTRTLD